MAIMQKIEPSNVRYRQFMDRLMESWINDFTYTPRDLAYAAEWGSLRQTANTAFVSLVYAKYLKQTGGDRERVRKAGKNEIMLIYSIIAVIQQLKIALRNSVEFDTRLVCGEL